jgi:hypothetical protein
MPRSKRVSIKNIFSGLVWQMMVVVAAPMVGTTKVVSKKKERTRFPRLIALHGGLVGRGRSVTSELH